MMQGHTDTSASLSKGPAWQAAEEYGCDMSVVEANLRLAPAQRLRQHDRSLRMALDLRGSASASAGTEETLLDRLVTRGVQFVVVGDSAAAAHGGPLLSQCLAICCSFSPGNLARLGEAIQDLHPTDRRTFDPLPDKWARHASEALTDLWLTTDYGSLDCFSALAGVGGYEAVQTASVQVEVTAGACRALGLSALIRAAEEANTSRDAYIVTELAAIMECRE